jgi:hypothetical protein
VPLEVLSAFRFLVASPVATPNLRDSNSFYLLYIEWKLQKRHDLPWYLSIPSDMVIFVIPTKYCATIFLNEIILNLSPTFIVVSTW